MSESTESVTELDFLEKVPSTSTKYCLSSNKKILTGVNLQV